MKHQRKHLEASKQAVIVRSASLALRLARGGAGPVLAFLPDWDAVDTLRVIAAGAGLATRLAVHHDSAAPLAGRGRPKRAFR